MQHENDDLAKVAQAVEEAKGLEALRSDTERLRRIIDPVETALTNGVRREAVLETLQAAGFTMTLNGFKTALQRIRAKKKQDRRDESR